MAKKEKEIAIDNAPFLKSLLRRSKKLYFTKSRKIRKRLSEKDTYNKEVLEICLRISGLLETLRLSRFFLHERIDIPSDIQFKIKNSAFIRYHIECYFIRITTFKDLILKLINRVLKYGIKENIGLEGNLRKIAVRNNEKTLIALLDGIAVLMKNIEPIRHKIAHGGYHDDVELIIIESEDNVRERNNRGSLEEKEYHEVLGSLIKRNIIDMHQIEMMMATFILITYSKLYPIRKLKEKEIQLSKKRLAAHAHKA